MNQALSRSAVSLGVSSFVVFAIAQIGWVASLLSADSDFLSIAIFLLQTAGLTATGYWLCRRIPRHPFLAIFLGLIGAAIEGFADVVAHPTINGSERNLWPLELMIWVPIDFLCLMGGVGIFLFGFNPSTKRP